MKRAASTDNNITSAKRTTRAAQRKVDQEKEEEAKNAAATAKAEALMATPLLQALPLVLTSGFIKKWEIYSPATSCKDFHAIWVETQHQLPEEALVDVRVDLERGQYPVWATSKGLETVLPTQEFGHAVFDKLCELKLAVETTERKKQKVREALPKVSPYGATGNTLRFSFSTLTFCSSRSLSISSSGELISLVSACLSGDHGPRIAGGSTFDLYSLTPTVGASPSPTTISRVGTSALTPT